MNKNNKKFKNKKLFITRLVTLTSFLVFIAAIITTLSINPNRELREPGFTKYDSYYDGSQVQISETGSASTINTITMTAAYDANSNNGKVITIESDDELNKFSQKCNSNTAFLGYSYLLIANINWNTSNQFQPIGTSSDAFTGTFDGQGYEISELSMNLPSNGTTNGNYYSMFNYIGSGGTVTNLGLLHPTMIVADAAPLVEAGGGVSFLVGSNAGTLSNSYIIDDGDALTAKAGISANGGAKVADLVVNNSGTMSNCYVAVSTVYDLQLSNIIEYNEIALSNTGTITNCCFYNSSIKSLTVNGTKATVEYWSTYKLDSKENLYFGTYVADQDALIAAYEDVSGWYTKNDYGNYKDYTGIKYAIRRGISLSGSTFTINNEADFAYMFELFNADDKFASNELTYQITGDLNLAKIPSSSYSYKKGIGATIRGNNISGTPTMANGSNSAYPTIFNANVMDSTRIAKSTGVDCYGLFNYLTGTVENLNVVATMDLANIASSTNAKGIGALSGYIEGGYVKNVNVHITVSNTDAPDIGEYYLGGISGILGGNGKINGATSAGTITLNAAQSTLQGSSSYMGGVAVGGIVGYVESSSGAVYTCLNATNITSYLGGSTVTYAIGGVIGAGYTMNYDKTVVDGITTEVKHTGKLENVGTITVGNSTDANHVYGTLYVSGVIGRHTGELDEVAELTNNGTVEVYANGKTTYVSGVENSDIIVTAVSNTKLEASQFKDSAGNTLFYASSLANGANVTVTGSSTNLQYTNVINVNAGNHIKSKLSDVYNLAYGYKYNGNSTKTITKLSAQVISMDLFTTFSPVVNVIGGTSTYTTKLTTAYNLRDITFNLTTALSTAKTFNFTGCSLGEFITYEDIKNEGALTVNLSAGISTVSTLKVSGLFETLSSGTTAKNLYNGGNITINEPNGSNSNKLIDMYLSGICYQNLAENSDEKQNPLNANFDSELVGTMDSVINNGSITVDSYYIQKDTATNVTPSTHAYYVSNISVGGITYKNKGIISNAFNLGNITVSPYSTAVKNYDAGGISCIMDGQYAQIRDSANNGSIYVIDLGGKATQVNSVVNVGGIVAKNTDMNTNSKEVIAFTINYGTIIGFIARDNMSTTSYNNAHGIASGVIGTGVCNLVNIVNYGNVYGKECVAGIMGRVRLGAFQSSYNITIANTLNYGQVKIIPPYDNSQNWATYNVITSLSTVRSNEYNLMYTHAGAICSIFDFNNQNNLTIRYLINLYNGELTVFSSLNTPTTAPSVATFITTKSATDSFGGEANKIPYAPLNAIEENGNIGVFSSNFIFRKAINGIGLNSSYVTDSYISDFFQFVKFDKVNQDLLEKIGWRTIAYASAAEDLVKNIGALEVLVSKAGTTATNLLTNAFTSDTWLSSCNMEVIESLIKSSINSSKLDSSITSILNYVLFDATATSSYTQAIRTSLIETILSYYEKQGNANYYEILQSMLYDTLLAKIVSEDNTNYAAVKTKIETVLSESTNLETVLNNYITLLQTDGTILNELFTGTTSDYYETSKINLVTTLLTGYDESTLESLYNALNLTEEDEDDSIKYKLYLQTHSDVATRIYSHLILNNSLSSNADYLTWINNNLDKYNVGSMIDSSELSGTVDGFGNITSLTGYRYSPVTTNNEYNSLDSQLKTIRSFEAADITSLNITPTKDYRNLWNIIKNDSAIQTYIANNYFTTVKNPTTDLNESGIIAKATEYTNSYQTNDRTMSDYGMEYSYDSGTNGKSFYVTDINGNKYYGGVDYGFNNGNHNFFDGNSYGINYPIRNRFIYVPDNYVTYRTNYLGPYATKTGIVYDQQVTNNNNHSNDEYFSGNKYGYKKGSNLAATDESTETARGTVPVLICINEGLASNLIASSGTSATDKSLYLYHWNDNNSGGSNPDVNSAYMWKHENFITLAASNTTGFIYNNYNTGTYMCDYYNFDPTYVPTQSSDYNTYTNVQGAGSVRLINTTGASHTYSQHYLTAYCSSAIITGLYYTYSSWPNKDANNVKCVSLLSKRDGTCAWNKVSNHTSLYFGVHTTDYICYKISDLVKLDGYKTKGFNASNRTNDQDETNIIGAIVTKLLTDNKALVLKAIYNYSVDNEFTADDANTLNMLITSITDTTFASSSVTQDLADILSMNYSGLQTILQHLDSLDVSLNGYTDKIIISTVSNQINFKNLLIRTLTDYSKKCSDYSSYNLYNRNDLNNFIYKYLSYLYSVDSSITASQIDTILGASSDSDLQKLEDLLLHIKNTVISYDDEEYEYNDYFTFYDVTLYSKDYTNYSSTYDTNYDAVIVAGDDDSYVEFTTGNYQYGYKLVVTYKGTIDLDGSNQQTSNTVTTYTYTGLYANSTIDLNFSEDTQIYDIKLYESDYSSLASEKTILTSSTSPFAVVDDTLEIRSANFVLNGDTNKHTYLYGNYYSFLWKNKNTTIAEMYIKINKCTNITYNSINISFKTLSYCSPNDLAPNEVALYYNNDGTKATNSSYNNLVSLTSTYNGSVIGDGRTFYQTTYTASISSSLFNVIESNDFYLTLYISKPRSNDYDGTNNAAFSVNDFIISYDFDFVNNGDDNAESNVVFNQNLFNPYYSNTIRSSYTITNSNNNCGVDISGGSSTSQSLTFNADSPTTVYSTDTKQINAALIFEPWYYQSLNLPMHLVSQIDVSTIDFGGDTIRPNFVNGKYDVSDVAKYLVKDYFTNITNNVAFNLANESFIDIHATGEGNISILDSEDIEIATIAVSTALNDYEYYEYTISNGTHKLVCDNGVSFDMAVAIPTNISIDYSDSGSTDTLKVVSGDDEKTLLSLDYSLLSDPLSSGASTPSSNNINAVGNVYLVAFNSVFGTVNPYDNYSMFYEVYPYKRNYNTSKTAVELRNDDVFNSIITLMATIHQDTDDSDYYSIFKDSKFTDTELINVIKLVAIADNVGNDSAFKHLFDGLQSTYYKDLLLNINIDEVKINIAKKIYNIATTNSQIAGYIYATYLGNDYLDHTNLYTSSIMYTLLNAFNAPDDDPDLGQGGYQFILTDTTVDADKVTALLSYISSSSTLNIDGYGIFALSSSKGIGEGIFIPDNLVLSTMDNYYATNDDVIKVKTTKDAEWRGGSSISEGATGTVDYAFYHDMKQLKKSISTNIFVLNLTVGSSTIYSVDDQIDNVNHIVTYYLPSGFGSVYNASSITIKDDYKLANGATLSGTTISLTGSNVTKTQGVSVEVTDAFTVYAEDTGVLSKVTLKFIAIDPYDFTLTSDKNSIDYDGGTVTLTLKGEGLPDGLDIEPYIVVTSGGTQYYSADGYWKLDPSYKNNAVVNNKTAIIKLVIDSSLPGGDEAINIRIDLSNDLIVKLSKAQSTNKNIIKLGFVDFVTGAYYKEGEYPNLNVPTALTSTIPYGRAYNYSDLTQPYILTTDSAIDSSKTYYVRRGSNDYYLYNKVSKPVADNISNYYEKNENFYLYEFEISANATMNISATKSINEKGLMTYVVKYLIKSEKENATKTYTHTLNESQYFTENAAYVSIFADGDEVTKISESAYKALDSSQRYKYLYEGTLTYTNSEDTYVRAAYDLQETYYQIRYSNGNVNSGTFTTNGSLYTLSNGIYTKVTSGTYNEGTTYYVRNYEVKHPTKITYSTDGSLYTLKDGVYTQVFTGEFKSTETYYGLVYDTVAVTSTTFTANGSLYTRRDINTDPEASSYYVYTQVIDRMSLTDSMFASVAFNRTDAQGNNIEPQYRIKYSLANFYTLGDSVVFGTTDATLGNLATTNITYAGLTVTVSENNDTGTYVFVYTYTNTGMWDNNEVYYRYYEFPEFIVEKQASTDALIHKLTFLEESIVLGNTATVILPTTPLVPNKSGSNYGNDDQIYTSVFASTTRNIVVSSSGVKYNNGTDATSITDYYAIGTVSDADLSYYCPGFEVNEYAQIYQYTTLKKLTSYGIGVQTETDSEVLSVHDNMYLYVPYTNGTNTKILLVEVDSLGYWRHVYTTEFNGNQYVPVTSGSFSGTQTYYTKSNDEYNVASVDAQSFTTNGTLYISTLVYTYPEATVNAKNAKKADDITDDYHVSDVAGEEDGNSSLYMDYVGTPLEGHFWYVSYVVFSEDYISGGDSRGNVRYYHISIIDATNNVQFEVTIYTDTTFSLEDIYLTISESTYKTVNNTTEVTGKRQISAYADVTEDTYSGSRTEIAGFKIYQLKYKLQTLPGGFFYFYVDLPDGYVAEARTDKTNNLSAADAENFPGAFDPQTSIITVKIQLEIIIKKGTAQDSSVWAVNTADIYTRQAEYKGTIPNN